MPGGPQRHRKAGHLTGVQPLTCTSTRQDGGVLAQDIPDGCLTSWRTGVSGHRGRACRCSGMSSKARLVITAVIVEKRPVVKVVRDYGVSRAWVYELLTRYRAEGEAAVEPRSRRPRTSPHAAKTVPGVLVRPDPGDAPTWSTAVGGTHPRLRSGLDWIPRSAERRCVGQVQIVQPRSTDGVFAGGSAPCSSPRAR